MIVFSLYDDSILFKKRHNEKMIVFSLCQLSTTINEFYSFLFLLLTLSGLVDFKETELSSYIIIIIIIINK